VTAPRHLKAVPKTRGQRPLDYRCDLVTQAVLGGDIDFRVQAMSPVVGPGPGTISIRLGRVVLVIEDREALEVLGSACRRAEAMADRGLRAEGAAPGVQAAPSHVEAVRGLPAQRSPRTINMTGRNAGRHQPDVPGHARRRSGPS